MGTTANSVLDERLHKLIGDFIEVDVTTELAASTALISTNLNAYDLATDNHFKGYWVYVTELGSITLERKINTYATSGGVCAVYGSSFTADSSGEKATVRIYKYSYTAGQTAINDAIREIYPDLHRPLEDRTLVTGNILPDNSFELWTSSSAMSLYSGSASATLTRTTTAGYIRGPMATTSMFVEAGDADQYAYISSDTFPRLLKLMNKTLDFKCWAKPSTANDAFLTIVYTDEDGDATTTNSTTECPADIFTLLKIEDLAIPDDIVKIEFRFRVHTNGEDAYFDSARVTSNSLLQEYMLLSDFADGEVSQVYIQSYGNADDICDDLHPDHWERVYGYSTYNDGTYSWLRLPFVAGSNSQLCVIGTSPLSTVSTFSGTTEIDGRELDLLIIYAAYCLFRNEEGIPSSEDTARYTSRAYKYLREYERLLPSLRMLKPSGTINMPRP